jgi:Tetratricopeptide repeat
VQLDEDTLARRRGDLGEDHPDTLAAASALGVSLRAAGEYQAARELDEDTLARRRRVLGEDHPDTLASASFALMLSGHAADPKAQEVMETLKAAFAQSAEGQQPDSRPDHRDQPGAL